MKNICLITDLHITKTDELPLNINTRQNFLQVLGEVVVKKPDLVILCGDLCHQTGDLAIYLWIKEIMDASGIPYCVIPGNHDDSILMRQVFHSDSFSGSELFYSFMVGNTELVFLDTSASLMSDGQYSWLEDKIRHSVDTVILVMHHPPVLSGSKHMEPKYMFLEMDKFQLLCQNYPEKKFIIFCGHYHLERTIQKHNMTVYITPSTFIQIDPDSFIFKTLDSTVGFRQIFLTEEGCLFTNIRYIYLT